MDAVGIGKRLKECRARCALSQEACAEKVGITARYLSDIERGAKIPKLETFVRILNVLTASADEVLQDNLLAGHVPQSNELSKRMAALGEVQKKQTLAILAAVIASFEKE